jgi:hypothetical protein
MNKILQINQSEREAIDGGIRQRVQWLSHDDLKYLEPEIKKDVICVTDYQFQQILQGINLHVKYMLEVSDDWLRAKEHEAARVSIIEKTRKELKAVY